MVAVIGADCSAWHTGCVYLERAPEAFNGLLEDKNFGKLIVRLAKG